MKQPKKQTLEQKKLMTACSLNLQNWMVKFEDKCYLHLINKITGRIRIIDKQQKKVIISQEEKEKSP